jgi:hypothetical protein
VKAYKDILELLELMKLKGMRKSLDEIINDGVLSASVRR